jgi:hypothetical protein
MNDIIPKLNYSEAYPNKFRAKLNYLIAKLDSYRNLTELAITSLLLQNIHKQQRQVHRLYLKIIANKFECIAKAKQHLPTNRIRTQTMPLAKKTQQCPGGHHGRAQPYKPTPQGNASGRLREERFRTGSQNPIEFKPSIGQMTRLGSRWERRRLLWHEKVGRPETLPSVTLIQRGMLNYNFVDTDV